MYSLPVQEAISLKSRCRQGCLVPAGGSEGESGVPCLSQFLVVVTSLWGSSACRCIAELLASDFTWSLLCVSVCRLPVKLPVTGFRATLTLCALTSILEQRFYFQIRLRSVVPGGHDFFWGGVTVRPTEGASTLQGGC